MPIYIYWGCKDKDGSKIYNFIKNPSFQGLIGPLTQDFRCYHRIFRDVDINEGVYDGLEESSTAFFFTHGLDDTILKYRIRDELLKDRYALVDLNNVHLLSDRNVVAICCNSANVLGRVSVSDHRCKSYLGFQGPIIYNVSYDDGIRSILYKAYSDAFLSSMYISIRKNSTMRELFLYIRKFIISNLFSLHHRYDRTFPKKLFIDIFNATMGASIRGLILIGDNSSRILD